MANRTYASVDPIDIYIAEIGKYRLLSEEEEKAAGRQAQRGEREGIEKLVSHNLRFAFFQAKKHQYRGLALEDLIGYSNEGLFEAAKRFDPDAGVKFISYAIWWIKQGIRRGIAEQHVVRRPVNLVSTTNMVLYGARRLAESAGREMTEHDIRSVANTLNVSGSIKEGILRGYGEVPLDAPLNPNKEASGSIVDVYRDESPDALTSVEATDVHEQLETALKEHLSERDQKILTLYFGLGEEGALTLEVIAARLGITRERVRQLKERSLDRLKKSSTNLHELVEKQ